MKWILNSIDLSELVRWVWETELSKKNQLLKAQDLRSIKSRHSLSSQTNKNIGRFLLVFLETNVLLWEFEIQKKTLWSLDHPNTTQIFLLSMTTRWLLKESTKLQTKTNSILDQGIMKSNLNSVKPITLLHLSLKGNLSLKSPNQSRKI